SSRLTSVPSSPCVRRTQSIGSWEPSRRLPRLPGCLTHEIGLPPCSANCNPRKTRVKIKRRRLTQTTSENPPPTESLFTKLGQMANFIAELREIAERADRERLSVLIVQFKKEYPDLYRDLDELVELPASVALSHLVERWPALGVIKLFPNHLQLISMIQLEIINRRTEK